VSGSPPDTAACTAEGPGISPGGRRLLTAWTACLILSWLLSREVLDVRLLAGTVMAVITPPWPAAAEALRRALSGAASAAFIALAASGSGRCVLLVSGLSGLSLDLPVAFAAGLPVLGLAFLGAGLAGLAWPAFLAAVSALPAIVALRFLRARRGLVPGGSRPLRAAVWCAVAGVALAACAPEVAWDAMVYHLRVPSLYLLSHRIYPVPEIFPSFFPFTGEMVAMAGRSLGGDPAARFLHALAWLGSGAMVGRLAAAAGGAVAGPLATAMFLTVPAGMVIAGRAYAEYYVILPFTASLVVSLEGRPGLRRLAASGWLAGAAFGAKYLGGFAALVAGSVAAARAGVSARNALAFTLPALAAGSAWLVRNALWTGNPVFPILFGGPRWTPADMAGWRDDARSFRPDPRVLLTTPWTVSATASSDGLFTPLPFIAAAVPVFLRDRKSRLLWIAALGLLLAWWVTSPLPRYLLPAFAVACATAACEFSRLGGGIRLVRAAIVPVLFLSALCGMKATQSGTAPYDVALGKLDSRSYRDRYFRPPGYVSVVERLDSLVPARGRAYFLGHLFTYGLERRVWFEFLYLRPPLHWWLKGAEDPERVAVRARQAGLTHIVWHPAGCRAIFGDRAALMGWTPRDLAAWKGFWAGHVRPVEKVSDWTICEVLRRAAPSRRAPGPVPGTEGAGR
jgi:hypothetical protein